MPRRFVNYPKGSKLLFAVHCPSEKLVSTETRLIRTFKSKFVQRSDIGREYFEGDPSEMTRLMFKTALSTPSKPRAKQTRLTKKRYSKRQKVTPMDVN